MPRPPRSNPKTRTQAIELRKEPTPAERKLWGLIRNDQLGVNFRRQHAIGRHIPDFVCIQKNLIIELDGSQHLEQEEYDEERTKYLNSLGYKVIRFWNNDVTSNIDGVILAILQAMENETTNNTFANFQKVTNCGVGWHPAIPDIAINRLQFPDMAGGLPIRPTKSGLLNFGEGVALKNEFYADFSVSLQEEPAGVVARASCRACRDIEALRGRNSAFKSCKAGPDIQGLPFEARHLRLAI